MVKSDCNLDRKTYDLCHFKMAGILNFPSNVCENVCGGKNFCDPRQ